MNEPDWKNEPESGEAAPKKFGAPKKAPDLKSLRRLIDQKNKGIVKLLNKRAEHALEIARIKADQSLPIRDDKREAEVLAKVSRYNKGPLSDASLHRMFNCIMEEHRRLEEESKGDKATPPEPRLPGAQDNV